MSVAGKPQNLSDTTMTDQESIDVESRNSEPQNDKHVTTQARSLAMVRTRTLVGVSALPVIVEVHLANGLPAFSTVGLPETAVKESKDRVRGAIINAGFEFPAKRITVNLSPADLPKTGSRFDLPIALGILVASGQISAQRIDEHEFVGELALDGQLRRVSGVLPTALASQKSLRQLILPSLNAQEAGLIFKGNSLHGDHLLQVCYYLAGQKELPPCVAPPGPINPKKPLDFSDVKGQQQAKRALEVAAAGGHSVLFVGPPGTGKSMLATRLPSIMPELSESEALESAAIQSVAAGLDEFEFSNWRERPFRQPHHSISSAALVGGGSVPKPGEISLAHKGILFLDELTEFSRATLEQLREPLETGVIHIARAAQKVTYPAQFMLIAACNPCVCGFFGDNTDRCQCSAASIERYRGKLSGPLLDRLDMHVSLHRVSILELQNNDELGESSSTILNRVENARCRQIKRQKVLNSQLASKPLEFHCSLDPKSKAFIELASERLQLSARAYHRILRLARTIADLSNSVDINQHHLGEAIGYRMMDRGR